MQNLAVRNNVLCQLVIQLILDKDKTMPLNKHKYVKRQQK